MEIRGGEIKDDSREEKENKEKVLGRNRKVKRELGMKRKTCRNSQLGEKREEENSKEGEQRKKGKEGNRPERERRERKMRRINIDRREEGGKRDSREGSEKPMSREEKKNVWI